MSNITPENLVPFTGSLKAGQRLLKLSDGSFIPVGAAGVSTSSSTDFYKCSSVDTSNHMWTGKKAVFAQGVYSFESDSTTGLTYTFITPAVGKVYSEDALVSVSSLYQGAFQDWDLYFPMTSATETVTGASLTNSGVTFTGQSAVFDGSSYLSMPQACYNKFNSISSLFFCGWFKLNTLPSSYYYAWDASSAGTKFAFAVRSNAVSGEIYSTSSWGPDVDASFTPDYNWHFSAFYSKAQGNQYVYLDGASIQRGQADAFTQDTIYQAFIGKRVNDVAFFIGELARMGFKFNEDLSAQQFTNRCDALRSSFTPAA